MRASHIGGLIGIISFLIAAWLLYVPKATIIPGVTAGPINLGGQNRISANEQLEKYEERKLKDKVIISHEDKQWEFSIRELGFQLDRCSIIQSAVDVGRKGTVFHQASIRLESRIRGVEVPLKWKIKDKKFSSLRVVLDEVDRPAMDAKLIVTGDEIAIWPHQDGIQVDVQQLVDEMTALIATDKGDQDSPSLTQLALPVKVLQPSTLTPEIEELGVDILLAKYTTKFDATAVNRAHNIKTAAKDLEFYLLSPGEIFSFNDATGPKTEEAGYKEAPIIVDNQMSSGVGGGVCQVSSTLYNSALLANLTVIERRRHSLIVNYVPVGTDATVVDNYIDLQLKNHTSKHMLINTDVSEGAITVKIFGNRKYKTQTQVIHQILEVLEPKTIVREISSLAPGEQVVEREGKKGYKTKVMRVIREEGKVIKEETISSDIYPPEDRIILVGQ